MHIRPVPVFTICITLLLTLLQDTVWGYALLINGLVCVFMVYRFGGERYRNEIVNKVTCMLTTYQWPPLLNYIIHINCLKVFN